MSRYGTFPYTTGIVYGPGGVALFQINNFVAKSRSYGNVSLSWDNPSGRWNRLRLVRSQYGYPASQVDGTVLFDSNSGPHAFGVKTNPINSFEDDGHVDGLRLTPGKIYYYTLWVEYSRGAEIRWARGADAQAIPVTDRGYLDYMLRRLPSVYTNRDLQSDGQPSSQSAGINRFMSILAFDLSRYRDTLETLRSVNDPDATNGLLLPSMGNQLAYRYEPEIGMRQNRVLLRNATYLAKRKGTSVGVSGLVSSVTGWGVNLYPIKNLMHDENDSNAKNGFGRWIGSGFTLSRDTTVAGPTDSAFTASPGNLTLTSTGTSGGWVAIYDDFVTGHGIPVEAGASYTLSAYFRSAATTRTPNLNIKWYDQQGVYISASSVDASQATSTTAWHRESVTGTAPANAAFATLVFGYTASALDEVQYIKAVQLEKGALTAFRPAREVLLDLLPTRINEVYNPSFETDTAAWSGSNASLARDNTVSREGGLASCLLTPAADGLAFAVTTVDNVVGGQPVAVSAYAKTSSGTQPFLVGVQWYDASNTYIGNVNGTLFTANSTDWSRATLLTRAPDNAAHAHVTVGFPSALASVPVHFDDVIFEKNDIIEDYFDRRTEPESAFIEGGLLIGNGRTFLFPLYPARYARAKALVNEAVMLGTRVTLRPTFGITETDPVPAAVGSGAGTGDTFTETYSSTF